MSNKVVETLDGSKSIYSYQFQEHYHSSRGAVQESRHIFIDLGLKALKQKSISIFEVGFGTGLNALLTYQFAQENLIKVKYHSIEKYPLSVKEYEELEFSNYLKISNSVFKKIYSLPWNKEITISDFFILKKTEADLIVFEPVEIYDLIYFDAFSPNTQPELWSEEVFERLFNCLNKSGILVTYSSKSVVRKALLKVGFHVEKHPGPPGKREVLKAIKV
jgi:tRNA U34 5-methylaminomethyl-2-thiouridine-forming methyltransferase MnmC